ncbi:MAG: hypothetical protein IJ058_03960 [Lachnospiraceae bacterium]|nr:hypothetical protein [Lachnospiraceae bacterium]
MQAKGSHIIGNVTLGRDSSVWYNAVIRGDKDTGIIRLRVLRPGE